MNGYALYILILCALLILVATAIVWVQRRRAKKARMDAFKKQVHAMWSEDERLRKNHKECVVEKRK